MRFKLGLILKLCIFLTVALLSLVLLRETGTSTTVGEYSTLSQKRQLKNDSKSFLTNSKITQTEKSSETSDLAEASDSLAGKRIDGLPNITETRFLNPKANIFMYYLCWIILNICYFLKVLIATIIELPTE